MNHLAFCFLLTTVNALQCYQTNFTKCESKGSRWSFSSRWFSFGTAPKTECHSPEPQQCDEGHIICNTLNVTFQDASKMEVKRCSKTTKCEITAREVEEVMGKTVSKLECGFCYGELCNKESANLTKEDLNTRCYVTSAECYERIKFNTSKFTQEELRYFKNRTYLCFSREYKIQRCNNSEVCLSIPLVLQSGSVLTLKECSRESENNKCGWAERAREMEIFTGRQIVNGECSFCDTNLCNFYTEIVKHPKPQDKDAIICHATDKEYDDCVKKHTKSPLDMYKCLKNMNLGVKICSEPRQCKTLHIYFEEDSLSFQDCGSSSELNNLNVTIARLVEKRVVNTTMVFCNQMALCNNPNLTIQSLKQRGPECYQSNLQRCIDNATLIIARKKMLACVRIMNENVGTKKCKMEEKCTTISLTMENNEELYYNTCGTGPGAACEAALKDIKLENYIGMKLNRVHCSYCESDMCNDVTSNARQAPIDTENKIQCYNSIPELCEEKFYSVPENLLENQGAAIYKETYDCLRNMKINVTWCKECLTLTFIFEDDSFQSAFCEDIKQSTELCKVPMNADYFKRFTKRSLKHTKCDHCNTDFCNRITIGGKPSREVTKGGAKRQFSKSIGFILNIFTVIYKIL